MNETLYLVIGVIIATIFIITISYFDAGDNDAETYMAAGVIATTIILLWPVIAPIFLFASLSWLFAEGL